MFKNTNSKRITGILLALVLVTSLFIGVSIARYVTSTSSEDSARVAVWGINEAGTTMDLFENEYTIDGSGDLKAKSEDDDDIIAPGLNGASQFKIVNTSTLKPEVMYEIAINLDDSEIADEIKNHPGIEWKVDNGEWGTWEEFKTELLSLSGDASGVKTYAPLDVNHEFANGKTHTVAWQWIMDSGYDEEDTAMGNYAAETGDITAKLSITVTARQTDVDSTGMLEGNGSVFNINDPQVLTFRADADYSTFKNVEVDDVEIATTNYETAPGSIKVKLKKEYLETLSVGTHKLTINTTDDRSIESKFTVTDSMTIIHNGIIPEGGIYYKNNESPVLGNYTPEDYTNFTIYNSGTKFPVPQTGDTYVYGDYEYRYNMEYNSLDWVKEESLNGWGVFFIGNTETPSSILTTISNKNITTVSDTFHGTEIVMSPTIPETVKYMRGTFMECSKLINAPIIPKKVIYMESTFEGCINLTNAPIIHSNVTNIMGTFDGCNKLNGSIEINANLDINNIASFDSALSGTNISWITGSISDELKQAIADASYISLINPQLVHEGIIPLNGYYYQDCDSRILGNYDDAHHMSCEDADFPQLSLWDIYVYDGREYRYKMIYQDGTWTSTQTDGWFYAELYPTHKYDPLVKINGAFVKTN